MIKPLIKWVGGKSQLIDKIFELFPKVIHHYYEPFIGGGSVLFELLNELEEGKIVVKDGISVYDNNPYLIEFYQMIKDHPEEFIVEIEKIKSEYENCGNIKIKAKEVNQNIIQKEETTSSKELYFYYIRQEYNQMKDDDMGRLIRSAYFLFLNKTAFRGLYRTGPNGFNVPYGNYKNPSMYKEEEIRNVSKLLNKYKVMFQHRSFEKLFTDHSFTKDDFIYFDPPYLPEKKGSFVGYNKDGFGMKQHTLLFDEIKKLKCGFLLSNSDSEILYESFKDYEIIKVEAKRAIKSNEPTATTYEVLIYYIK